MARPLTARLTVVALLGAALLVSACGLPRSGPTKGEIYKGSVEKGGTSHVIEVDDRVSRAANYSPAYGFGSDFRNAGQVGADEVRPGDVLGLSIWENVDDGLLTSLGIKIHWALPFRGSSKPIERSFRDLCDTVAKHLQGRGIILQLLQLISIINISSIIAFIIICINI